MRPLETVFLALSSASLLIWLFWRKRPRDFYAIPILALLVMVFQLIIERYRWQLLPVYAITGAMVVVSFMRLSSLSQEGKHRSWWEWLVYGSALLLLPLGTFLAIAFPIPKVRPSSGPYEVGTFSLHLVDESRKEIYSDASNSARELMAQFWYPANPGPEDVKAPYMSDIEAGGPAVAGKLNLPKFSLNHIALVTTNAFLEAPIDKDGAPFPLLLFSHGWGGMRVQNTSQIEELVSHGYVVAAVDHTYGAIFTVFPDGRVVLQNREALPSDVPDDEYEQAAELLVSVWSADLKFLLDIAADMNEGIIDSPLMSAMDLSHVGVFGHSTGGGTTVEFCAHDDRCTAALGMDTWLLPVSDDIIESGIPQPFMFMHSEGWTQDEHWDQFMEFYPNMPGTVYSFSIEGTRHYDFSDIPLLSALAPMLGLKGPLDGERVVTIVNAYTLAFFNQTLKGMPESLLSGSNPDYPEVIFEFREP